jgi:phosphatidylglycerophosphatase A
MKTMVIIRNLVALMSKLILYYREDMTKPSPIKNS